MSTNLEHNVRHTNQAGTKTDSGSVRNLSRRKFGLSVGAAVAGAAFGFAGTGDSLAATSGKNVGQLKPNVSSSVFGKIPLGFDNFSIRANKWKADKLIEFAKEQEVDALLFSDLDVYENHSADYLAGLKSKLADAGIKIHVGTGGICPTSARFDKKWGTAEEHLRLGLRIAKQMGSPVFRCYLGGMKDRHTEGGIEKHIATTVDVLKKVKSQAVDSDVKIAVENHAGDMQAWELVGLIKAAGEDFVGATIDSGNATWTLENPQANLEVLGPYAVSAGIRDSTVWETDKGCKVAWNAIGEGQVDWKLYTETYAKLCPGVPFQLEIISGFSKPFNYNEKDFWKVYPKAKASDFARFLEMARAGKEIPNGKAGDAKYQTDELLRSIRYCKETLGLGLNSN